MKLSTNQPAGLIAGNREFSKAVGIIEVESALRGIRVL